MLPRQAAEAFHKRFMEPEEGGAPPPAPGAAAPPQLIQVEQQSCFDCILKQDDFCYEDSNIIDKPRNKKTHKSMCS